ncbi:hypothetical protein [Isoptericola haloaureus]|uniref:Glycosyl transferase family 2 n=1 Tax=Isoptericola haloaureus TaxID=1542902 RepID=A0ABU7Z5J2_9MICO
MTDERLAPSIPTLEGHSDYDVRWAWESGPLEEGMTAVLRVKDEAQSLPFVLPPLFEATQRVVVVDNQSTDGTPEVARTTAERCGAADRLFVTEYPFAVSRAGSEHLATPPRSVHSLTHFYNWSFSHVTTRYSMKWDGDMVLTREGAATIADLSWQLRSVEAVVAMPRHSLYVEDDRVAYLDLGLVNAEPWIYPMGSKYQFTKAFEWEWRAVSRDAHRIRLPEGLCVELKHLDSDEFAHWTAPEDFANSSRTARKRHEWNLFHALREGRWQELDVVERIEAPEGTHVIDYVCDTWLPRAPRPLQRRGGSAP